MNNPYNWVAFHPPRKQQIIRVNCRTAPNEKVRSGSPVDLDLSASESTMKTFLPGTFSTLNQEGVFTQPAARRPWVFFFRGTRFWVSKRPRLKHRVFRCLRKFATLILDEDPQRMTLQKKWENGRIESALSKLQMFSKWFCLKEFL